MQKSTSSLTSIVSKSHASFASANTSMLQTEYSGAFDNPESGSSSDDGEKKAAEDA